MTTPTVTLAQLVPLLLQLSVEDRLKLYHLIHSELPSLKSPDYIVYNIPEARRLSTPEALTQMVQYMQARGVVTEILYMWDTPDCEEEEFFNVYGSTAPFGEHPEARAVLPALLPMMRFSGVIVKLSHHTYADYSLEAIQAYLHCSFFGINKHETTTQHVVIGGAIKVARCLSIETTQ